MISSQDMDKNDSPSTVEKSWNDGIMGMMIEQQDVHIMSN